MSLNLAESFFLETNAVKHPTPATMSKNEKNRIPFM